MDLEAPLQKPENENKMHWTTRLYKGRKKQNEMNRNKDRMLERSLTTTKAKQDTMSILNYIFLFMATWYMFMSCKLYLVQLAI